MPRACWEDASARFIGDMTTTPQQVANYFLDRADKEDVPISQMKLLKLVYIAYGWYLALTDDRLFDEGVEAWEHGPVIPSLYHEFKHFGKHPITAKATQTDWFSEEVFEPRIPLDNSELHFVLSKVWAAYKIFDAWSLRNKTHEDGSPWKEVFDPNSRGVLLNDSSIKEHYKERIKKYIKAAQSAA